MAYLDYLEIMAVSSANGLEGIECNKFLDPQILEKQKLGYLRLIGEFNKSLMELTIEGPSIMAIEQLKKKIENAGIDLNLNDISDNNSSNRYNERTDKYESHIN